MNKGVPHRAILFEARKLARGEDIPEAAKASSLRIERLKRWK